MDERAIGESPLRDLLGLPEPRIPLVPSVQAHADRAPTAKEQRVRRVDNAITNAREGQERRHQIVEEDGPGGPVRTRRKIVAEVHLRLDNVDARIMKKLKHHFAMPATMVLRTLMRNELARINSEINTPLFPMDDSLPEPE